VREVAKDYREYLNLDNDFLSARLTWDFDAGFLGPVTLVTNTGYITTTGSSRPTSTSPAIPFSSSAGR
jgi:hypothetical protein